MLLWEGDVVGAGVTLRTGLEWGVSGESEDYLNSGCTSGARAEVASSMEKGRHCAEPELFLPFHKGNLVAPLSTGSEPCFSPWGSSSSCTMLLFWVVRSHGVRKQGNKSLKA